LTKGTVITMLSLWGTPRHIGSLFLKMGDTKSF
jgi:hypothetical protein